MKDLDKFRTFSKITCLLLCQSLVLYILFENYQPFGLHKHQSLEKGIPFLYPSERVKREVNDDEIYYRQVDDLIYFSTKMKNKFDVAKVKIVFINKNLNQKLYLGYKDQKYWHYNNRVIDNVNLDIPGWSIVGKNPTLFQRNTKYKSNTEFLEDLPEDSIIGLYNFNKDLLLNTYTDIPGYKSSNKQTVISTPLRGSLIIYTYLKDERFNLELQKQDLNWYEGADEMEISVFKEGDLVYKLVAEDDGIDDSSKKVLKPQNISIQNPGSGIPETGVYKILIKTSNDTVIKSIKSNLHKIVFEGPIFPIENSDVYPQIVAKTNPTIMFTNSLLIKARAYHKTALQELILGERKFTLNNMYIEQTITPHAGSFYKMIIPKSNVSLSGIGYFAFSEDQFFTPTPYSIFDLSNISDFQWADYILTSYTPPKIHNDIKVAEHVFDLSNAVVMNGTLSWILRAPGLKESSGEIIIKDIQIDLYKRPMIKLNKQR